MSCRFRCRCRRSNTRDRVASIASKLAPCMLSLYPTRGVKLGGVHTSECVSGGGRLLLKAGFAPDLVCRKAPPPHCPPRRVSRSRRVGLRITRLQWHEVRGRGNRRHFYLISLELKAWLFMPVSMLGDRKSTRLNSSH